jgi:sortase A
MDSTKSSSRPLSTKQRLVLWSRDLLFVMGVVAAAYVGFTLVEARLYQASANEALLSEIESTKSADPAAVRPVIRRGDVIGRIDVLRLGMSVAILQGTTSRTLRLGAGHIEGTPLPGEPGNSGVAGHRDTFFRSLKDIRMDDEIQIQTASGLLHYQVDWVKIVSPNDTSVLQSSGDTPTLTLVTCYPFYLVGPAPRRFVVHARKTGLAAQAD